MIDELDEGQPRAYDFNRPIDPAMLTDEPLFAALTETAAFRRLGDIRFLGGIDYLLVRAPNGARSNRRFTRYQHSLGVARLALRYAALVGLPASRRRLAYAAALLHDIGHGPLSHSIEPVFREALGIDHHVAGREIVLGAAPIGGEIPDILRSHGVDPFEVCAVIDGTADPFDGMFAGPINLDTIEGILRTKLYRKGESLGPNPLDVVEAAVERRTGEHERIVDDFWRQKDQVYTAIVRSRLGVLADQLCQDITRDCLKRLTRRSFFTSETAFFRRIPELRRALVRARMTPELSKPDEYVRYRTRRFVVRVESSFFARDDNARYLQTKRDVRMNNVGMSFGSTRSSERNFFDDGNNYKDKGFFEEKDR